MNLTKKKKIKDKIQKKVGNKIKTNRKNKEKRNKNHKRKKVMKDRSSRPLPVVDLKNHYTTPLKRNTNKNTAETAPLARAHVNSHNAHKH